MTDFAASEQEVNAIRIRARARAKAQGTYEPDVTPPKELVQRWNKGLVDLISAPTDLINAGIRLATFDGFEPPQIPSMGEPERQLLADRGYLPDPNDPASNPIEHAAEILGAGALPHIAFNAKGAQLINQSILQMEKLGILKSMAVGVAQAPKAAMVGEAMASVGAGTARTVAEANNASMPVTIMAELLGGFAPGAVIGAARSISVLRIVSNSVQKHLMPFTREGAWQRAAKRMRDLAADPEKSAASIDVKSDMPPARQAGDERLLSLEKSVLNENPELASETNKLLNKVREELKSTVMDVFGGDKDRPRKILTRAKQYLIDLMDVRASAAADNVRKQLTAIDPNATPREINQRVRAEVDNAYTDARKTEKELWESIESNAPVDVTNARASLDKTIATRSRFDDPDDIPGWLVNALAPEEIDPRLLKQLQQAGAVDRDGNIIPGMRDRLVEEGIISGEQYTFNDASTIRSRVLREIRAEQAKDAPNRNKIRVLSDVADGLLDDIGASGVAGAKEAKDFSYALNEKFTRGQVGRLLGYDRTGAERISEKATLDYLLAGKDPTVNMEQLVNAAPETRPLISDYLRAEFVGQTKSGSNRAATNRFIDKWERRGAFEIFPELKGVFRKYANDLDAANALGVRADKVRTFANNSGKSTAALYLGSDPGDEMRAVLNSKRPATNARKLRGMMYNDPDAEAGLRTAFLEEGFASSQTRGFYQDGTPIYSGDKFTLYLSEYKEVARALGMKNAEWDRLESIALRMRQLDAKPGVGVGGAINDTPAAILDLAAKYIGAQQGGRMGNSMGSSLVMAGAFSSRMRAVLDRLTRNTARQLLIDAHRDPALYRALLTNPTMPAPRQEKAAKTLQAWLIAVGATQDEQPQSYIDTMPELQEAQ
jgi:hypothetical protein